MNLLFYHDVAGCEIYAFDPARVSKGVIALMAKPNFHFTNVGLTIQANASDDYYSFQNILNDNGHNNKRINYLKVKYQAYNHTVE